MAATSTAAAHVAGDAVIGYPSSRGAAELIGVNASTLARREDIHRVQAGQEARLSPSEVIRLTALYRRRSTSLVAGELVTLAGRAGPEVQRLVAVEVDEALARYAPRRSAPGDAESFLANARRWLPADLAAQVERVVREGGEEPVQGGAGWAPDEEDEG